MQSRVIPVKHNRGTGNCSVLIGIDVLKVNIPLPIGRAIVLVHKEYKNFSCSSMNSWSLTSRRWIIEISIGFEESNNLRISRTLWSELNLNLRIWKTIFFFENLFRKVTQKICYIIGVRDFITSKKLGFVKINFVAWHISYIIFELQSVSCQKNQFFIDLVSREFFME